MTLFILTLFIFKTKKNLKTDWPHYGRFTDGWLHDSGVRIMPSTSWKAYCGFNKDELFHMKLQIGEECLIVGGVPLNKNEGNTACGGSKWKICGTDGMCCVKSNGKPTDGGARSCCSGQTDVTGNKCR